MAAQEAGEAAVLAKRAAIRLAYSVGAAQFSLSPGSGGRPRIGRPSTELVMPRDCMVALVSAMPTRVIRMLVVELSEIAIIR